MKLVLASILVLLASPLYAQEKELNETSMGSLRHEGNAMLNDSKVDDPSEYRGGAPATQRSLVKISGDVVEGCPARRSGIDSVETDGRRRARSSARR